MYYFKELFDFLDQLAVNNDRVWFNARRSEFERLRSLWLEDLDRLIGLLSVESPELSMLTAARCTYRINRNLRFSADKTPYKTHVAAEITKNGRNSGYAGYYISAGDDNELFGGLWAPEPAKLAKIRRAIVDNFEEWEAIDNAPEMKHLFPGWWGPALKTVPRGYAKDHPQAAYLRLLHYGKCAEVGREFYLDPAWPERAAEMMSALKPMVDFLNYTIDE